MTDKILIFASWLTAGIGAVSFFSLICRFSPALRMPFLLLLGAALLIMIIIGLFASGTRPWMALISAIILIGGAFAWLL